MAKSKNNVLTHYVHAVHPERGSVTLEPGTVIDEDHWAVELITNPDAFDDAPDDVPSLEQSFAEDFGTGSFEGRKKEQLVAVARQFGVPHDESATKAEIISALEQRGIESTTVIDS